MSWMVGVLLLIGWIVGAVVLQAANGVFHLLLAAAILVLVFRTLSGRRWYPSW